MAPSRGFRHAGHTPSLLAGLVHFDVSFMVWVLLGALGAYVAADLDLSPAQKGLMVAVPPLGGAVFRLVVGALADRVGIKRTGLATLALTVVPLAWGATAGGTYGQVLGIGLLLGVAGASFAVALPLAGYWYPPEHRGLALGIAGAGNSGTLIAALAAPRLAEHVGWHGTFGLALIPVVLAWIVFAVLAKEPPRPVSDVTAADRLGLTGSMRMVEHADARWLAVLYMVTFGGFVGLSSYLPMFFVDHFSLSKVTAGGYTALCAAAGSFLRPLGGFLADRTGGARVMAGLLGGVALIAVGLAALPGLGLTVGLLFLLLGALGMGNGAVFQLVPERFPRQIGTITGLVGAAGGLGGFFVPSWLGSLRGVTGSFAAGFLCVAALAAGSALIALGRHRAWRAEPALVGVRS